MPEGFEQTEAPQDAPSSGYEVIPASADTPFSPRDAANALAQYRYKRDAREARAEGSEERAAAEELSPSESNDKIRRLMVEEKTAEQPTAAREAEAPAEVTTEAAETEAQELPAIEPPRSWSKEWKEEFQSYPREVQEKLAQREQERDAGFRRGQNEAAEQRKALDAERAQMEQIRKQYEETLPTLLASLQQSQTGDFSDIKTMNDVERLAREDWPRYALWDAHQKKIAAVQQEMQASQQRAQQEFQSKWTKWATDEDNKFLEAAPEMSNKETAAKVTARATELLNDLGFTENDINSLWRGEASVSLRDHRVQLLIRDAMRYREAKAAVPKAVVKPVPKVQRPGTPTERASDRDVELSVLNKKLDSGEATWRDGAELIMARRAGRR